MQVEAQGTYKVAKGIKPIFRICIEEGILEEYLEAHRGEVEKIMLAMVSPEYIEKAEQKSAGIREAVFAMRSLEAVKKSL